MGRHLILTLLLTVAGPAAAAMFKWTDDKGNVHYSQTPPSDRQATTIAPPPKVTPPAASGETAESDGQSDDPVQQAEARRRAIYRENCEAARGNLDLYQTAKAITEGGQVIQLDEKTRARRLDETRRQIKQFCGEP